VTNKLVQALGYTVIGIVIILFYFPIAAIVLTALKPYQIATIPTLSFTPTLENFKILLFGQEKIVTSYSPRVHNFIPYMLNSVIISTGSTLLVLISSAFASFAFSRFNFRGKFALGVYIFVMYSVPAIVYIIPIFLWINAIGLYDTYLGVILPLSAVHLPWTIWMMKSFFDTIPRDLEEAAMVDGCSQFGAFTRVIIPLSISGLAVVAIFTFINTWNNFMVPLILTGGSTKTIMVWLAEFRTERSLYWGPLAAASLLSIIPSCIFASIIQKYIVQGLTLGAVKGTGR